MFLKLGQRARTQNIWRAAFRTPEEVGSVAMEHAGITLLGGDLMGILRARKLAKATLRNTRQNLFFAFACNADCIPIAAGMLWSLTGILLSPMIAAAAMGLSSVSVIANALRLRRVAL